MLFVCIVQLSTVVRIHGGHPPAIPSDSSKDDYGGLPVWLKTPSNSSKGGSSSVRLNATMGRMACRFTRILNLVSLLLVSN